MDDDLIKFNTFLLDVRGRSVRCYMKAPIPAMSDPAYDQVLEALTKHGIDVAEYRSSYEASTIPSNNKFSLFTINIFKSTASLVPHYSKYQDQLKDIVQEHLDSGTIERMSTGKFVVLNQGAFPHHFKDIDNMASFRKHGQSTRQSESVGQLTNRASTENHRSHDTIAAETITTAPFSANRLNMARNSDTSHQRSHQQAGDPILIDSTSKCFARCLLYQHRRFLFCS